MKNKITITEIERQAFFEACRQNGIALAETPNEANRDAPIIIDIDGRTYSLGVDMQITPLDDENIPNSLLRSNPS